MKNLIAALQILLNYQTKEPVNYIQCLINELEAKKAEIEGEIINLTDLAPTSKESLAPSVKDFNANVWVETLQALKLELYRLDISINLAKKHICRIF